MADQKKSIILEVKNGKHGVKAPGIGESNG